MSETHVLMFGACRYIHCQFLATTCACVRCCQSNCVDLFLANASENFTPRTLLSFQTGTLCAKLWLEFDVQM